MQISDLKQIIAGGESKYLEFKRRVPNARRIAKEMIALANTEGGKLLLGVSDDGSINGLRDIVEEEFALQQALDHHTMPIVEYTAFPVRLVDTHREVLVIDVPESVNKPHFLVGKNGDDRTAYVRVGDKSVEASPEALELMYAEDEDDALRFEFGKKEQVLMRYLDQYERITVDQYARLVDISANSASEILVHLTKINVLSLHANEKDDFFTLAYPG
jgi:predicted HTH transcriptional regulator